MGKALKGFPGNSLFGKGKASGLIKPSSNEGLYASIPALFKHWRMADAVVSGGVVSLYDRASRERIETRNTDPTYSPTVSAINGRNVLTFATNKSLTGFPSSIVSQKPFTFFIVAKATAIQNSGLIGVHMNDGSGNGIQIMFGYDGKIYAYIKSADAWQTSTTLYAAGVTVVIGVSYNGAAFKFSLNKTIDPAVNVPTPDFGVNVDGYVVFGGIDGFGLPHDGQIADVIIAREDLLAAGYADTFKAVVGALMEDYAIAA